MSEDMGPRDPHSTGVYGRCDGGKAQAQDSRETIADRTDDSLTGIDALVHGVLGVEEW